MMLRSTPTAMFLLTNCTDPYLKTVSISTYMRRFHDAEIYPHSHVLVDKLHGPNAACGSADMVLVDGVLMNRPLAAKHSVGHVSLQDVKVPRDH